MVLALARALPVSAVEVNSSLTAWVLTGDLLVHGDAAKAAEVRALPCGEVHAAIDAYNRGELRIVPPPQDWEPASSIDHYLLTALELRTLLVAAAGLFESREIVACTSPQPGWAAARPSDAGQTTAPGPIVRLVSGDPPGCEHGQLQMVGSEYVWDWVGGRWSWGYGRDWRDASQLINPSGLVGALTYVYACLTVAPPLEDFAGVASLVPLTQVQHNPPLAGLTRLDTWLWYDFTLPRTHRLGPLAVQVTAAGRTWDLLAEAWVDRVLWNPTCTSSCRARAPAAAVDLAEWETLNLALDLPDTETAPADVVDGGAPSADRAAATFAYRTKGWYDFAAATVWRGVYTYNGVVYAYDPVVVADAHPYQVVEVRSRLMP